MSLYTLASLADLEPTFEPRTTAATIGLFDGVHIGHRHIFDTLRLQAAAAGRQTLAVTFEQNPQHELRPHEDPIPHIMTADDRVAAIGEAGIDNVLVVAFTPEVARLTSTQFMQLLRDNYGVDRLVVGFNNRFGSDTSSTFDDYRRTGARLGVTVIQASQFPMGEVSSTLIRRVVRQGDVKTARHLLGRPFTIKGIVEHGHRRGTAIGFPTANVGGLSPYQLMPSPGAYAVTAVVGDDPHPYRGMAGVGTHPTVADEGEAPVVTLEVNLFDFEPRDTYGSPIAVSFIGRLRDEVKFASLEALGRQLAADRLHAHLALAELDPLQ